MTQADSRTNYYVLLIAFAFLARIEWGYFFSTANPSTSMSPFTWLYALFALLVLYKPQDLRLFLAMYAAQIIDVVWTAPQIPNHWLITFYVGIAWWAVALHSWLKTKQFPDLATIWLRVIPALQIGTCVFYLFTAFWKSNATFLDPQYSCVVTRFLFNLHNDYGVPKDDVIRWIFIIGTLLVEYLMPLLLFIPRTRLFAVVGMTFFHFLLALDKEHNYQNFSWAMFPLLAVFIPAQALESLTILQNPKRLQQLALGIIGIFLLLTIAARFDYSTWWDWRWNFSILMAGAWLFTLVFVLLKSWENPIKPQIEWIRPSGIAWIFVALVFLNGISPILGVKNRSSWQMYSNINLDNTTSNHWFLPPSLDVFGLLRDQVELVASNDGVLQNDFIKYNLKITWHDLLVRVSKNPEMSLTWRRDGQEYTTTRAGGDPRLPAPNWLVQKLVWFRPIGPKTAEQCAW
jgi:hypothetical protein